jgi:Raf kinase inhibitor-like YbhB/YbcL family protein
MDMKNGLCFVILALFLSGNVSAEGLVLTSSDLNGQMASEQVFSGFGCSGGNLSPQLQWSHPPAGTRSFAVTAYDPDAPTGSGWWHWVVYNLPSDLRELKKGAGSANAKLLPEGSVQGVTDFGQAGYGGACPPVGDRPHRYIFTIYALDVDRLELGSEASPALVGFQLNQHALSRASLIAYYGR